MGEGSLPGLPALCPPPTLPCSVSYLCHEPPAFHTSQVRHDEVSNGTDTWRGARRGPGVAMEEGEGRQLGVSRVLYQGCQGEGDLRGRGGE